MEIDSAFAVRDVENTFVALDHASSTVRTEHTFQVEALRPHRFFIREYRWVSDEGIEKPPVIHSGSEENGVRTHRLHGPVLKSSDTGRVAVIDLGRLVRPGDIETVQIGHFFISTSPKNPGFVGHLATPGCERIRLRAVLPKNVGSRQSFRSFRSGSESSYRDVPLKAGPVGDLLAPLNNADDWVEYSITVDKPKVGERYRIEWDI